MRLIYGIAFALFSLAPLAASAQWPTCYCCRHTVPTTTTRTRLASVMPSLCESSRLKRS